MSRSNLLRKIKKETQASASQFIRAVRLEQSKLLLQKEDLSVSEVAYAVGFSSVSYYIKCFRERYGSPPGQHQQDVMESAQLEQKEEQGEEGQAAPKALELNPERPNIGWLLAALGLVAVVLASIWLFSKNPTAQLDREKSIAVLPFSNESSDSSNLYFVNGLMQSTLSNLQKIEELRVVSRTSSELYRYSQKSLKEIADELEVAYVVEGSGQKIGDQVLLSIQLIDAEQDRPLWTQQYQRKLTDIFSLQKEIAEGIAESIKVFVSPTVLSQLEKRPTESVEAYDLFLQGQQLFNTNPSAEDRLQAIELFTKATEIDPGFALAYADIAMSYYLLDLNLKEKQYSEQINSYADKALLHDPKLDVALIAKAAYYLQNQQYRLALPHLEKALDYNPNSISALQMLSDFYAFRQPNTAKYLEYALMANKRNTAGVDSMARSYICVQLSNAFLQNGFFDEALHYVDQALQLFPENYFAPHLRTFVLFAKKGDYAETKDDLLVLHRLDTNRLDILQDLAKLYFALDQKDSAFFYYQKLVQRRKANGLKVYQQENVKIASLYAERGLAEEAAQLFAEYQAYVEADQSVYKQAFKAVEYAYLDQDEKALQSLERFVEAEDIQYWFLLLEEDPLLKRLKTDARFLALFKELEESFWQRHQQLEERLKAEDLL